MKATNYQRREFKTFYDGNNHPISQGRVVNTQYDFLNVLSKMIANNLDILVDPKKMESKLQMKSSYSGVSKVNLQYDEFNQSFGEELAECRCFEKYNRDFGRHAVTVLNEIRALEAAMIHYCYKHNIDISSAKSVDELKVSKFGNYYR